MRVFRYLYEYCSECVIMGYFILLMILMPIAIWHSKNLQDKQVETEYVVWKKAQENPKELTLDEYKIYREMTSR